MKRNMKQWMEEMIASRTKKPLPILSFPAVQVLDVSVQSLVNDGDLQAQCICTIARQTPSAAAVGLMDLSVEAECFGAHACFHPDEVPTITGSIVSSEDDLQNLAVPAVGTGRTGICIEGIRKACQLVEDRPVLAGIIGPYSLAGRLMDVTEIIYACYDEPELVHGVLQKASDFLIEYARAYRDAGANGVIMAEPLAGVLSPELAEEFSCEYVRRIVENVQEDDFAVIYHNCGNSVKHMIPEILSTGCMAYHFGNAVNMAEILAQVPKDIPCMGNIDPASRFCKGTPESMHSAVRSLMADCAGYPNFILSSGCDIPPKASWENIRAFFRAAEENI